jgi:hypothetical protein
VLEGAQLFWISTVRTDGRPHVTPLVGVWFEGAVHFSTGADEQKAVNLRSNPQVTLTTGCNGWDEGLDVVVEGHAVQLTDDAVLERLAQIWAEKWDGRWQWTAREGAFRPGGGDGDGEGDGEGDGDGDGEGEGVLVFSVAPTKVLAFAKGTFSHTRHVF